MKRIAESGQLLGNNSIGAFVPNNNARLPPGDAKKIEEAAKSQLKINFALVDSGAGGAMAAALLPGEVRQLASMYCLPIGDKPQTQAAAFTAAMTLWPLVAPLKNSDGKYDDKIAEHVVVACNSASVRVDKASEMIKSFCDYVSSNQEKFVRLDETLFSNIVLLDRKIKQDKNYLSTHIHEIVTPTAEKASKLAFENLTNSSGDKSFFIRIDSTAGTCESLAYPKKIVESLVKKMEVSGFKCSERTDPGLKYSTVDGVKYPIHQSVLRFEGRHGEIKSLYLEGRGNPPWVCAIECNSHEADGADLVVNSDRASREVFEENANCLTESGSKFLQPPDLELLCCTHYPAMKSALQDHYRNPQTQYLNQAEIVSDLAKNKRLIGNDNIDPLSLAMTFGSIKENGVDPYVVKKDSETGKEILYLTDAPVPSDKINRLAPAISSVIQQTRADAGRNDPDSFTLQIFTQDQDGVRQEQYELIHRFIGLIHANEIMQEQYYNCQIGEWSQDGKPKFAQFEAIGGSKLVAPKNISDDEIEAALGSRGLRESIGQLAKYITTGETRGIDRVAALVDVERQLQASVAKLSAIIKANVDIPREQRSPVAINSGFTVVDNLTHEPIGGENDGPPGAAILAKTIVELGTPVIIVTDKSAEASLLASLESLRIVSRNRDAAYEPADKLQVEHFEPSDNIRFEIAVDQYAQRRFSGAALRSVSDIRASLGTSRVPLIVTGERLSPPSRSMVGVGVAEFNTPMDELFLGWAEENKPFMIGIGDGGNEYGTGNVAHLTRNMRLPNLDSVVSRGPLVAADPKVQTDTVILASVSNTGFAALAMAAKACVNRSTYRLNTIAEDYDVVINHLYENGISFDGVNKVNALTVDGTDLGTRIESLDILSRAETLGQTQEQYRQNMSNDANADNGGRTTHHDRLLKMEKILTVHQSL